MKALWWVVGALLVPLLLGEIPEVAPWVARQLTRLAARRLPEQDRPRWEAEWLAELESTPGRLTKLLCSLRRLPLLWGVGKMRRLLGVPSLAERLQTRTRAAWQKLQSPPKTPHEKVPGVEAQPPPSVTIQPLPIQVEASALPASVDIRTTWMLSILEGQDRTEPRSWPHDDKPLSYEAFLEWLAEQQLESDRYLAQQQRDSDRFLAQQMLEFERGQPGFWMSAKPADQR